MVRSLICSLVFSSAVCAQGGSGATLTTANAHVSLAALAEPTVIAPKSEVTLRFDVSPRRRIHVYAPGAEYQVITIKLDPQPGVEARKLEYPPSEIFFFAPTNETVPVYQKPFTLRQVVRVSPAAVKGKTSLTLSGSLDYQACDDKVCFKPGSIPFSFDLAVKGRKE